MREDVRVDRSGIAQVYLGTDGTLVYVPSGPTDDRTLFWLDLEGNEEAINAPPRRYLAPSLSPDGTRVALEVADGNATDIWIYDFERELLERLMDDPASDRGPRWTPDGERVVFASDRNKPSELFWTLADGTGNAESLVSNQDRGLLPGSWSFDGKVLVVTTDRRPPTAYDVGIVTLADHQWSPLLHEPYFEFAASVSPDGRWLAYSASESGRNEVYVRPFPDGDAGALRISADGGSYPVWSPDGGTLYYDSARGMMSVTFRNRTHRLCR